MSNACIMRLRRFIALSAILAWLGCWNSAPAQSPGWTAAQSGLMPFLGAKPNAGSAPAPQMYQRPEIQHHAPLARLIENPDQTDGTPPFALTDQTGTIQRYVEPVPGVDLAAYVGQVVAVRNDTGSTLLASQLELPRQPLRPLVGTAEFASAGSSNASAFRAPRRTAIDKRVEPAQYIDNDDSSVQLLPDDMSLPGGQSAGPGTVGQLQVLGDGYPGYSSQMMPGQMMPGEMMPGEMYGPGCGPQGCNQPYCDPMQCGPGMMQPYAGSMVGPCPQCGQFHNAGGCGPQCGYGPTDGPAEPQGSQLSFDVEFMFYRVRMSDNVVGKLSESYQFTPRFILNFSGVGNLDGRVRYWLYERDTNLNSGGSIRFEFNVLDIEATHRFEGRRSQLVLAAGLRLADLQLRDDDDEQCGSDMLGLTMAADGLTPLICMSGGYCGWVYGGRVSLLGGDWGGDDNCSFLDEQFRDDNVFVTELYAGAEIARKCRNATIRGRVVFEIQNWRSDALAAHADIESIGFLGPALQIGADF